MDDIKIVKTESESIVEQKRCPNCDSTDIEYNPITGKLRCNYCKFEFEKEKVKGFVNNLKDLEGTVVGAGALNIQNDDTNIITCKCTGCGAEITLNANEVAYTKCHWCHSALSLNTQVSSGIVADAILPFKTTKEEAFNHMKEIIEKRKFFVEKNFYNEFSIENLRGVYLPFLVADVNGHAVFKGIGQKITDTHYTTDDNGNEEEYSYDVDLYDVEREFDIQITNLAQTAKSGQLNWKKARTKADMTAVVTSDLMPFDIENSVKWDANYINGYSIEKRDLNIGDISDNMGIRAKDVARLKIYKDIDYDGGVCWNQEELEIYGQQWKTVYLPVWIYSYVKGNSNYIIAENGRKQIINFSLPVNYFNLIITMVIFLFLPIISLLEFVIVHMWFNHFYSGDRYEIDTKSEISNVYRQDVFKKHKKRQKSKIINGANETKVEGNK